MDMVQTGQKPEYDELRLTVEALRNMLMLKFMSASTSDKVRFWECLTHTPEEYLGWDNNPDNPEYQERVQASRRIAGNVMKMIEKRRGTGK